MSPEDPSSTWEGRARLVPNIKIGGFFFALPRLVACMLGRPAPFSENNYVEALFGSAVVFVIPFLAGLELFANTEEQCPWWIVLLLIPAVFLSWLLALYGSSCVIRLLRKIGLGRTTPERTQQHRFVSVAITLLSTCLALGEGPGQWIGIIMLTLIALDLFAVFALPLTSDPPAGQPH